MVDIRAVDINTVTRVMKADNQLPDICDFHAHILPGADHGSQSVKVSLLQLTLAEKYGVIRVIATPHFYPEREDVASFIERRDRSFDKLIDVYDGRIELRRGAEVLICDGFERIPMLESLCFSGSNVILVELPFAELSSSHFYSVKALIEQNFNVVIAHADRYSPKDIDRLIAIGCRIQLNATSLSRLFIDKHIVNWLESKVVVGIGSDIHQDDKKAYRRFKKALKRIRRYVPYIREESNNIWRCIEK